MTACSVQSSSEALWARTPAIIWTGAHGWDYNILDHLLTQFHHLGLLSPYLSPFINLRREPVNVGLDEWFLVPSRPIRSWSTSLIPNWVWTWRKTHRLQVVSKSQHAIDYNMHRLACVPSGGFNSRPPVHWRGACTVDPRGPRRKRT